MDPVGRNNHTWKTFRKLEKALKNKGNSTKMDPVRWNNRTWKTLKKLGKVKNQRKINENGPSQRDL